MKNKILFYALSLLLMISLMPQMVIGNNDNDIVNEIIINNNKSDILILNNDVYEYQLFIEEMGFTVDTININSWQSVNFTDYKLILSVPDCLNSNPSKFGDAAADYLDQGGRFIGTIFSWQSGCGGNQGRYQVDWAPWALSDHYTESEYSGNNSQGSYILEGVDYIKSEYTATPSEVTLYNGSEVLAYWDSGAPMISVKDSRSMGLNFLPYYFDGDMKTLLQNAISYIFNPIGIEGIKQLDYKLRSQNILMPLNITIENGTTYDAYLNDELVDTQDYQNGTIDIDISKIYSNYTYTNYTVVNNTKYQYSNLTLAFHTEQNNTYTHFVNVTVFDYLPQVMDTKSMKFDYEIGTSLPLKFNVSDDNPDMVYVYSYNVLLYSQNWTNNLDIDVSNFINSSNKLGYNYYNVIFEDMDKNQVEYNLQIIVLDTVNPIFTSVFADDYIEGNDFGAISFSVEDVTLDSYAVFVNDIVLANSTFGNTSYIEISNAGFSAGNYEVEIVVYDRANNIAKITTSFVVELQGVTSTVTVDPPVNNSTVTSDTSTNVDNTITITETNNVTIQGNNTQNVSVPATLPISDLPLMLFASLIGLYFFRKNRK